MFRTLRVASRGSGKKVAPLTIYTAIVLAALKEAGIPRNDPMVRMAIDWLMGCQNADGGYAMPKGTPSLAFSNGAGPEGVLPLITLRHQHRLFRMPSNGC